MMTVHTKVQIYAFCESSNQIEIANYMAAEWRSWANVTGVSFGRTFRLDPAAVIAAENLADFIFFDRAHFGAETERLAILGMGDWLKSISSYDPYIIAFNDGSRLCKAFVEAARRETIPSFIVQDGFLGHETNIHVSASYGAYKEAHRRIMSGEIPLADAVRNTGLRELYQRHCQTTKIGATQHAEYFVRGADVAVKMCMIHAILPKQITVVGSVHGAMSGDICPSIVAKVPKTKRQKLLYVGQCHTLHGKIKEDAWLRSSKAIFDQLAKLDAEVFYKFHPSETASIRGELRKLIPTNVSVMSDGVLKARDYAAFDFLLSECSTSVFDALHAGIKVIVQIVDALPERLPEIADENVFYTEPALLEQSFQAIVEKRLDPSQNGVALGEIECGPIAGFFNAIGERIKSRGISEKPWPFLIPSVEVRNAKALRILGKPLSDVLRNGRELCVAQYRSREVVFSALETCGLAAFVPFLYALYGAEWHEVFFARISDNTASFQSREHAVLAQIICELDETDFAAVQAQVKFKPMIDSYVKMTRAALDPMLGFEQRIDMFDSENIGRVPDSAYYLVAAHMWYADDKDRAVSSLLDFFDNRATSNDVLEGIVLEAEAQGLALTESLLVGWMSRSSRMSLDDAASLLISMLQASERELSGALFASEVRVAADMAELKNFQMNDVIAFLSRLAEILNKDCGSASGQGKFGAELVANVLSKSPNSRRGLRARAYILDLQDANQTKRLSA